MTKNTKTPLQTTEATLGMLSVDDLYDLRRTVERLIVVMEGDRAWQELEQIQQLLQEIDTMIVAKEPHHRIHEQYHALHRLLISVLVKFAG